MGKTVRQLLAEIDSAELTEWMAYAQLEPFGSKIDNFRSGMICATVANYAGKVRGDKAPAAMPDDFMPALDASPGRRSSEEPILLDDPEAQARLLKAALFGVK